VTDPGLTNAQRSFARKEVSVRIRHIISAAGATAIAFTAMPAQAATPVTQSDGKALVLIPLSLTKIQDLDFGSIVPSAAAGTVTLNASTSARTFTGGVSLVPSDAGFHGYFAGAGTPNQQVLIALSPPVELANASGDKIPVVGLTLDGPPMRTVDPVTRAFFVGVGGTLSIAANQPVGTYAANFWVTAIYQ
jgi:hypothetical protein